MEGFGSILGAVYIPFDPTMFLGISFTVFIIGRNEKFRSLKLANSKINCGTLEWHGHFDGILFPNWFYKMIHTHTHTHL